MTTQEKTTIIDWATVGVIISWATFWLFLLSPFGLLAWLAILVYLIIKKGTEMVSDTLRLVYCTTLCFSF
jgi:hypothetical protein